VDLPATNKIAQSTGKIIRKILSVGPGVDEVTVALSATSET
jgi:hypothetical protein